MHAYLFVPLPLLVWCVHQWYGTVVVSWQHPGAVCAAALPGLLHVLFTFFLNALISVPCCQG
jgi:hypothetical protein